MPIHLAARVRPEACSFLRDLPIDALATVWRLIGSRVSVFLARIAPFLGAADFPFFTSVGAEGRGSRALLRAPAFATTFRVLGAFIGFLSEPRVSSAFPWLLCLLVAGVFSLARLPAFFFGGAARGGGGAISIPNIAATSSSAKMRWLEAAASERAPSAPADAINSALSTPRKVNRSSGPNRDAPQRRKKSPPHACTYRPSPDRCKTF